jgi:type VI protein secretion system component Hcp
MRRRALSLLRRSPLMAAVVGVLVLASAGFAVASALPGEGPTIDACIQKESGALRVVGSAGDCRNSERAISFAKEGPRGPAGQAGADGAQGPQGPAGKDAPTVASPHQAVIGTATLHRSGASDITFDILGVDFSVKGSTGTGSTGAGAGKVTFAPLTIVKRLDASSPLLTQLATGGTASGSLTVDLVKPGAATPYRRYTAAAAFVTGVEQDAPDAGGRPAETVTLEAAGYTVQAPAGPPQPVADPIGRITFEDGGTTLGPVPVYRSSFGVTASSSTGSQGSGAGAGKATFGDFTVRKSLDAASGPLLQATLAGTHFSSAKLELFDAAGRTTVRQTYDLSDVTVTSLRDNATGETSTSPVQEDIVLQALGYAQTDGGNTTCWDVGTNAGC